MEPGDVLKPRVFLCKAGRFLENINTEMGGDYDVAKERFGNDDFQETCDPKDLEQVGVSAANSDVNADTDDTEDSTDISIEYVDEDFNGIILADVEPFDESAVEIISVKDEEKAGRRPFLKNILKIFLTIVFIPFLDILQVKEISKVVLDIMKPQKVF
jgi:hypothetical protein